MAIKRLVRYTMRLDKNQCKGCALSKQSYLVVQSSQPHTSPHVKPDIMAGQLDC
jgi:hypothetical protein